MIGIYFLKDGDNVVYIGQSVDIEKRIEHHERSDKKFDSFYFEECSRSELSVKEKNCIIEMKPKYNKFHNSNATIEKFCAKIELRNKLVGFQARQSEKERIDKVTKDMIETKSEWLREIVMKEVARLEKKSK